MQSADKRFPETAKIAEKANEGIHKGHDFCHAKRVAHFSQVIAMAEWQSQRTAELAGLASLCHNADRILQETIGKDKTTKETIEFMVRTWIAKSDANQEETDAVVTAVLIHSGRNDPSHSMITLALRDADRVVNMELDLVIRSGQHYYSLPAVDYVNFLGDPEVTYHNPKSVLRDISFSLEWINPACPFCFQTPTGMKLGLERSKALQWFFDKLREQLKKSGLLAHIK